MSLTVCSRCCVLRQGGTCGGSWNMHDCITVLLKSVCAHTVVGHAARYGACLLSDGVGLAEGCGSAARSVALPITAASRGSPWLYGLSGVLQPSHLVCMCLQAATACWLCACPSLSYASCCSGLCLLLWPNIRKIVLCLVLEAVFFWGASNEASDLGFACMAVQYGTPEAVCSCIPLGWRGD
jgi:hypothetical protein